MSGDISGVVRQLNLEWKSLVISKDLSVDISGDILNFNSKSRDISTYMSDDKFDNK